MQQNTIRIDLGSGQFADVLDTSELRDGDRVAIKASYKLGVDPDTKQVTVPGDREDSMRRALLCRLITGWNLQFVIPSKRPDSLDRLTIEQARALYKGTQEHFDLLTADEDDEADPTGDSSSPTSEIS